MNVVKSIDVMEIENENGDIMFLEVKFNGESFMLNRGEVHKLWWDIHNAFDRMLDPSEFDEADIPVII